MFYKKKNGVLLYVVNVHPVFWGMRDTQGNVSIKNTEFTLTT
jgi:hypothetical protein